MILRDCHSERLKNLFKAIRFIIKVGFDRHDTKVCFLICYLFFISISFSLFSQVQYPQNYFRSPIDTVIKLNGNFGELRSNHFHTGLDIATGNHEGMKVYAVADGYVSRIKVSPYVYGKSLQIRHSNGYISVYGHLRGFNDTIAKYVKAAQYANKSFEVELNPRAGEFPVKKGDLIAFSGNTGSSQGPHLHFEIRDTTTEIANNPLLFDFDVKDNERPVIYGLTIYPVDETGMVDGLTSSKKIKIIRAKGNYKIAETPIVNGNIGFGIEAYDSENNSNHHNGVYSIELLLDSNRHYFLKMDKIPFTESRYINSHIDYPEKLKSGKDIHRLFVEPNNRLGIYKDVVSRGIINFSDNKEHEIIIRAKDYFGNTSVLKFKVKGRVGDSKKGSLKKEFDGKGNAFFDCRKENKYQSQDFLIDLPANVLYGDLNFQYSVSDSLNNTFSGVHHVLKKNIPVHDYYDMSIKVKKDSKPIQDKLLIVNTSDGIRNVKDCIYDNNCVRCKVRVFGDFKIAVDTVPPVIKPFNIQNNKNLSLQKSIKILIDDNLSGIKTYSSTIDGNWILMEYEPKKKMLFYDFDGSVAPGKHIFSLEVTDERGNTTKYQAIFFR